MDQVGICNLALAQLACSPIASLSDGSTAANLCAANWAAVRDAALEARPWSFAVKREAIAVDLIAPAYGWSHRYRLPALCLRVLEVDDGTGYSDFEYAVEGGFILTNQASPVSVRYARRIDFPGSWSPGFCMAVGYHLAFVLVIPLAEDRSLQADLWRLYEGALKEAARLDGMQGRSSHPRSTALAARRF